MRIFSLWPLMCRTEAMVHKTLINLFRCHGALREMSLRLYHWGFYSASLNQGGGFRAMPSLSSGWFVQLNRNEIIWDMQSNVFRWSADHLIHKNSSLLNTSGPRCVTFQRKWKTRSSLFYFLAEYETGMHRLFHYSDLSQHRLYSSINTSDLPLPSPCSKFFFSKATLAMNNWTVLQSKCHSRENCLLWSVIRISLFAM